jgi:methylamine dehydrogenase accessory protein MauD
MSPLWSASIVALWVFSIVLTLLVLGLYRQIGQAGSLAVLANQKVPDGAVAPTIALPDQAGSLARIPDRIDHRPTLLVFGSPDCPPCNTLAEHLNQFSSDTLRVVFVASDDEGENLAFARKHEVAYPVLTQSADLSASQDYAVRVTPFLYCLDEQGVVRGRAVVSDVEGVRSLLDSTLGAKWVTAQA